MKVATTLGRASARLQGANRSRLLKALRSRVIIVELVADRGGYLDIRTVGWASYWQPFLGQLGTALLRQLRQLQEAREAYFASEFEPSHARAYCFCYLKLLQSVLLEPSGTDGQGLLQALAGLESFRVRQYWDETPLAAGAVSLRHPIYLLGKLGQPRAWSDPKFLPLAYLPPSGANARSPGRLFYHYRQLSLDAELGLTLLMCPSVALAERGASFQAIEWLAAALRSKPDPWSRRRARQVVDAAVGPFLTSHRKAGTLARSDRLSFVDLGGGSGILISRMCQHLLDRWPRVVAGRSFAWTFVDLNVQDPARHVAGPRLRNAMALAEYVPADYQSWVLAQSHSALQKWDVVLVCRLLNNMSTFSIESTQDASELRLLAGDGGSSRSDSVPCWPVTWSLEHGQLPPLAVSTSQVALRGGRSMRQLSLSAYFEALGRLTDSGRAVPSGTPAGFFPLRRFNMEALVLADGSSLLEQLCAGASLVVIEDVDLSAELLKAHLGSHGLSGLAASDATDRRRMHSAQLLCITRRELAECLPGQRIW
jgi:hypothetical protein